VNFCKGSCSATTVNMTGELGGGQLAHNPAGEFVGNIDQEPPCSHGRMAAQVQHRVNDTGKHIEWRSASCTPTERRLNMPRAQRLLTPCGCVLVGGKFMPASSSTAIATTVPPKTNSGDSSCVVWNAARAVAPWRQLSIDVQRSSMLAHPEPVCEAYILCAQSNTLG
jgi:hypothetical protein